MVTIVVPGPNSNMMDICGSLASPRPPWEMRQMPCVLVLAQPSSAAEPRETLESRALRAVRINSDSISIKASCSAEAETISLAEGPSPSGKHHELRYGLKGTRCRHGPSPAVSPTRCALAPQLGPCLVYIEPLMPACQTSFESHPEPPRRLVAIPGTMSSRPGKKMTSSGVRERALACEPDRPQPRCHRLESSIRLGSRLKTAVKSVLHRGPLDTSGFERIRDRHWSDD